MSSDIEQGHPDGTLFIVSGPSGAGKTTLIENTRKQLAAHDVHLYFSVSHTTQGAARGREVDGRELPLRHLRTRSRQHVPTTGGIYRMGSRSSRTMYGTVREQRSSAGALPGART
jgi:ABC-type branched-subunit amino acid transport system ATPase component